MDKTGVKSTRLTMSSQTECHTGTNRERGRGGGEERVGGGRVCKPVVQV